MAIPAPHAEQLAAIPVREGQFSLLGSTTRFWDYGPEDASHTVVICHGYRGDHHGLEPVIARLPGIRVISPDLPGFGASTPMTEAEHDVAGYARWFTEFVDRVGQTGTAIVLGHSFGSMITSRAVADGLSARALILINPISTDPMRGAGATITWLTQRFYGLARRVPKRVGTKLLGNWLVVQFMSMSLVTTDDKQLRKWIHEEHHRYFNGFSDPQTVAEGFDASLSTEVGKAAPDIAIPVLMIAGEQDNITPVEGQYATVKLFADARLEVIPVVGHLIHYEAAVEAAEAIQGFLAELDTRA